MTTSEATLRIIAGAIIALTVFTADATTAQTRSAADAEAYRKCLATAETAPDRAIEQALRWERRGGGHGARHCAAVAFARRGDHAAAAERLESLARSLPENTPQHVRAELFAQAGNAWIRAGKLSAALAVLAKAVDLAPNDATIRIDRAVALSAASRHQDAVIDLSAALIADGASVEALVLRARAYRQLGRLDDAVKDVDRALVLSPHDPGAMLERGVIRKMQGDRPGAATDWRSLIARHPESAAAEAAREYLSRLGSPPSGSPAHDGSKR